MPAFREGKRIKRKAWMSFCFYNGLTLCFNADFVSSDLLADDWEVEMSKKEELKDKIDKLITNICCYGPRCMSLSCTSKIDELFEFIDQLKIED